MKRQISFLQLLSICIIISIVFLFSGCVAHSVVRADYQNNTIWISKDPEWVLVVNSTSLDSWAIKNHKRENLYTVFDYGTGIYVLYDRSYWGRRIFEGRCSFHSDYFTVEVKTDKLFDGQYETITFRKLEGYTADEIGILYDLFGDTETSGLT